MSGGSEEEGEREEEKKCNGNGAEESSEAEDSRQVLKKISISGSSSIPQVRHFRVCERERLKKERREEEEIYGSVER